MARIARGDQDALQELYAHYSPKLRRYMWHPLQGDMNLIEETIQDVFLAVWRGAGGFRGEAKVTTWLFRIAYHCLRQNKRAASRQWHYQLVPFAETDDETYDQNQPNSAAHDDEIIERLALHDALGHLSDKHREVLELIFEYGFSLEEVAQILAIPLGTVKSRISYARRALRQELTPAHAQESDQSCQS